MFSGVYTALVTPFSKGKLDETALKKLIEFQVKGGVDGIVPVGTTGESPTVDFEEHVRIIELSVYYAKGRCKIIAGSGANSTEEAVYLTKSAEYAGADGSLQVCPYYNSLRKQVSTHISVRSRIRQICQLYSTAFPVAAMWSSRCQLWCVLRGIVQTLLVLRKLVVMPIE